MNSIFSLNLLFLKREKEKAKLLSHNQIFNSSGTILVENSRFSNFSLGVTASSGALPHEIVLSNSTFLNGRIGYNQANVCVVHYISIFANSFLPQRMRRQRQQFKIVSLTM